MELRISVAFASCCVEATLSKASGNGVTLQATHHACCLFSTVVAGMQHTRICVSWH